MTERPWFDGDADGPHRHAPATRRNRKASAEVLMNSLPVTGVVLEVASGSGEHCAQFAREFPGLIWQPSDPDAPARTSIVAWCERLTNVRAPLDLDAAAPNWPIDRADACVCINMVHVSPWEATLGLLRSEEHTSELQSLMRISYAVSCLKKKKPYYADLSASNGIKRHKPDRNIKTYN